MNQIKNIIENVKQEIRPKESEKLRIDKIITKISEKIEKSTKKLKIESKLTLGGSIAKGTWLSEPEDIDFFMKFDKKYEKEDISNICLEICKDAFKKVEVLHGSRDYFNIHLNKYKIEIVPVLEINEPKEAKNSMDISPFHVLYVKTKIDKNKSLADEIRIMKKFCQACNCYGAETYLHGFSGYAIELLIIHYGSFLKLINSFEKMQPKIIIDTEKFYKTKEEIINKLSDAKKKSPIILIDPVLPIRNACASLSYESFSRFLFHARMFLRNPSKDFFKKIEFGKEQLKRRSKIRGTKILFFNVKRGNLNEETFLAILRKKIKSIKSRIESEGFNVYDADIIKENQKIIVFFEIETIKVSKMKRHFGPPVWVRRKNFDEFIRKWKNVYVYENRLAIDRKRTYKSVKDIIQPLLS
ncbi:MAG: CCA tRNA nucleotidyltransferase [Candidatus Parvarchaeota archaeon]|nr:CCA tRNA nucleotidyltransferase [Candidatus Jingweiarchaeum tengchongense]MCW1298359.1 CCA tRNA nucleotidyltransferase [Candidatus Jingweiarchaeum tengchongense]MCW1300339.1 CCA tRNA nucleotidyltransferase [Candidatus Jingweiarchaeum tengchongense]MCW1304864.1 CCA tRNA nucleotidyltransferase [Candidatus Jingweiarchaeum tengchongense]MCW1305835.1 CCA tRNA nucleotidyltransferase [Candidatus Jingweiarchaeum tengchongense]